MIFAFLQARQTFECQHDNLPTDGRVKGEVALRRPSHVRSTRLDEQIFKESPSREKTSVLTPINWVRYRVEFTLPSVSSVNFVAILGVTKVVNNRIKEYYSAARLATGVPILLAGKRMARSL